MASPMTVAMLADISDLQTKNALAKASMRDVAGALREQTAGWSGLTKEARDQALPAIQALVNEHKQLSAIVKETTVSTKDHGAAQAGLGAALLANRGALMEVEHSARAMADGLASGANPVRLLAQESARLVQAFSMIGGISASVVAGIASVGAAAATAAAGVYLYYQRISQLRDSQDLAASFSARGLSIPGETIQSYRRFLTEAGQTVEQVKNLTDHDIDEIISSFEKIPKATPGLVGGLLHILPDFANMNSATEGAQQAAAQLAGAITNLSTKGRELVTDLDHSGAALKAFNAADSDPVRQRAILFDLLSKTVKEYSTNARAAANTNTGFDSSLGGVGEAGAVAAMLSAQRVQEAAERSAAAWKDFQAATANAPKLAPDLAAVSDQLERIAQRGETAKDTPEKIMAAQVNYLRGVKEISDDPALTKLFDAKVYEQQVAASRQALAEISLAARQAGDKAVADRKDQTAAILAVEKAGLADARLDGAGRQELETEIASTTMRLNRAVSTDAKKTAQEAWQAYKAGIEEQVEAAKGNFTQQIALLKQEEAEAVRLFGERSAAAMQAEKAITAAVYEQGQARLRAMETQLETARSMAKAQADITSTGARPDVGEFKPNIGLVVDDSGLQEKVAGQVSKLREALDEQLAGLQQDLQGKLALANTLDPSTDQYASLVNSAASDFATIAGDVKTTTEQITTLQERAAQAVQQSWQMITDPIGNAFDTIVDGALRGNERMAAVAQQAAASIVASWLKAGVTRLANWAASELGMTGASAAGAATRDAIGGQSVSQELQQIAQTLSKMLAAESAKTGAVVTGVGVQTAAKIAGAEAGKTAQAAAAAKSIMGDAAKAFSGTYAALAGIPIVGPVIAPIAAAGAFVAVAAYETLASAEGGWDRVPSDGMGAILHKNEMVLPAGIADTVRNMAAGGLRAPTLASAAGGAFGSPNVTNNSGGNSSVGDIHYSPTIHAGGASSSDLAAVLRADKGAFTAAVHSLGQNWFGNGGLSLPGRTPWR